MTIVCSPTTPGFYLQGDPGNPEDATIVVAQDAYGALLAAQAAGQMITFGSDGPAAALPAVVPPTAGQLAAYATSASQALIATPITITAGSTTLKSDARSGTLADWMALQQWASANPSATTQWIGDDGTVTALPANAVNGLADLVGARSQAVWQSLAAVLSAIDAGTITTIAEIDAASWPASA